MPSTIAKTQTGIGRQAQIWNECETHGFQVRLYDTMVYEEKDGKVILDNGGWVTPTTVRYMNQAIQHRGKLDGFVRIRNHEMEYCYGSTYQKFNGATLTLKF